MYIVCEMLEYFKGVIRSPKLKKERRYNDIVYCKNVLGDFIKTLLDSNFIDM
jgi:hypothetical protein